MTPRKLTASAHRPVDDRDGRIRYAGSDTRGSRDANAQPMLRSRGRYRQLPAVTVEQLFVQRQICRTRLQQLRAR